MMSAAAARKRGELEGALQRRAGELSSVRTARTASRRASGGAPEQAQVDMQSAAARERAVFAAMNAGAPRRLAIDRRDETARLLPDHSARPREGRLASA